MSSLTRDDWNTVLTDVNVVVTNPPAGVICTPLDPLPLVGPNHIWSRQDVLDVYLKLKQMYCSEAFVPWYAPIRWNQSTIDIIYNSLAHAWCDCPTFQATHIYYTLPLRPYACGDVALGGDPRGGYLPPIGNTFNIIAKLGTPKVLCPSSSLRRWRAYSSVTGDGKSRWAPGGPGQFTSSPHGDNAHAQGLISSSGRIQYGGPPYDGELQGPTWRHTFWWWYGESGAPYWRSGCNDWAYHYTYSCDVGYPHCGFNRDIALGYVNETKATGRDRWEFTVGFEIWQAGEWLPINTLADADCAT